MKVEVTAATERPMEIISKAAGTCYGKSDYSAKRVKSCYQAGHMSVFEHASATFAIDGISRACSHQLVRHRLASFSQMSQRYCQIDTSHPDWYVKPPSFEGNSGFDCAMRYYADDYVSAIKFGVKPEDARYLLPEACKTSIVVTMNARELFHFLDVRQDKRAQWEIRELAEQMETAARLFNAQWDELMSVRRPE